MHLMHYLQVYFSWKLQMMLSFWPIMFLQVLSVQFVLLRPLAIIWFLVSLHVWLHYHSISLQKNLVSSKRSKYETEHIPLWCLPGGTARPPVCQDQLQLTFHSWTFTSSSTRLRLWVMSHRDWSTIKWFPVNKNVQRGAHTARGRRGGNRTMCSRETITISFIYTVLICN